MSTNKYSESEIYGEDGLDDLDDEVISVSLKKVDSGYNSAARRRLEEYYERKALEEDIRDDLYMYDDE